jgi:hypothetical protein
MGYGRNRTWHTSTIARLCRSTFKDLQFQFQENGCLKHPRTSKSRIAVQALHYGIISGWADAPFPLISIPGHDVDLTKAHKSIHVAPETACSHNGMIRALNSIYQQRIQVSSPADIADLVKYTQFWCDWIHHHHRSEETLFFPEIERFTGVKGSVEKTSRSIMLLNRGCWNCKDG